MKITLLKVFHSLKRIMLALIAIPLAFFMLCVPVWGYGSFYSLDLNDRISPPGEMIDLGSHELHLNCSGEGLPTVILEAGSGGWSASWAGVKNLLSEEVRVCAYDRAGLGWSERGPNPRNAATIATELRQLLDIADENAPWLFVGHSFGGTIGLTFIENNPEMVAGFVAVETPTYSFMKYRHETRFILRGLGRKMLGPYSTVTGSAVSILKSQYLNSQTGAVYSDQELAMINDPGFKMKMAAMITKEEPYIESLEPSKKVRAFPVAVVQGAASHLVSPQWNQNQQELLAMSEKSRIFMAHQAHHGVPRMAPEVIIEAVNWVRMNMNEADTIYANHLE